MTSDTQYPRFSRAEYNRRYENVRELSHSLGLDGLVVFGWSAMGRAAQADVHYLSGYLGARDNYVVFPVADEPVLIAQNRNHIPNAAAVSIINDVRWGGPDNGKSIAEVLIARGMTKVGVVGWMPYQQYESMRSHASGAEFRDVSAAFRMLRVDKSAEEIEWLRKGAAFTDLGLKGLHEGIRPGMREYQLAELIENSYLSEGGMASFYYLSSTSMANPDKCVPSQVLGNRVIEEGDLITTEMSIGFGGYAGQGLRSYTVAAEPTSLVAELHEIALGVYDAVAAAIRPGATQEDVWAASDIIDEKGFTICDGLLHGFGMGILPPSMMTRQTAEAKASADWVFKENQTIVIQPNVVTHDESIGVQVGELCVVTPEGAVSLHNYERALLRCA